VALIGQQQVFKVFEDGDADKVSLYALRNVTTGDTVNVGNSGLADFLAPKTAIVMGTTVAVATLGAIAGTVITMPAGLTGDAGYMLVWGSSA
jgi:hypothetical protein